MNFDTEMLGQLVLVCDLAFLFAMAYLLHWICERVAGSKNQAAHKPAGMSVMAALRQLPTDDEQARQMQTEQLVAVIKLAARLVSTQLSTETKVTHVEAEELAGSFFTWLYIINPDNVALWRPAEALMAGAELFEALVSVPDSCSCSMHCDWAILLLQSSMTMVFGKEAAYRALFRKLSLVAHELATLDLPKDMLVCIVDEVARIPAPLTTESLVRYPWARPYVKLAFGTLTPLLRSPQKAVVVMENTLTLLLNRQQMLLPPALMGIAKVQTQAPSPACAEAFAAMVMKNWQDVQPVWPQGKLSGLVNFVLRVNKSQLAITHQPNLAGSPKISIEAMIVVTAKHLRQALLSNLEGMYPGQAGEDLKDLPDAMPDQLAPLLQALDRLTVAASNFARQFVYSVPEVLAALCFVHKHGGIASKYSAVIAAISPEATSS